MKKIIFIDESGNCDLNSHKKGESGYYILTAIIIEKGIYLNEAAKLEDIIKVFYKKGELKSSGLGNKHDVRIKILSEVNKVDYKIYSLVVDKRLVTGEGLKHKKSFIKFINGMFCEKLFKSFANVRVISDKSGSIEFQNELKNYILKKKSGTFLFDGSDYNLVDSKLEPFVQLADLISGTINKIQQRKVSESISNEFVDLIKDKIAILEYWPPFKKSVIDSNFPNYVADREFGLNEIIKRYSVDSAVDFIVSNPSFGDENISVQVSTLKFLLSQIENQGRKSFVYSTQIIKHVKDDLDIKLNHHGLSSKVISKLRDAGVIISSGEKGYKIPCTLSEISEYIKSTDAKVVPMLKRIKAVNNSMKRVSVGELDLVKKYACSEFVALIETIEEM